MSKEKQIILDASALLALLQEEPGSDEVEQNLSHAVMSAVNYSEVLTILVKTGFDEEEAVTLITDMLHEIIPFDAEQAALVAFLYKETKKYGLSFGDRACLALGQLKQATVFTADKIWSKLHIKHATIKVIR